MSVVKNKNNIKAWTTDNHKQGTTQTAHYREHRSDWATKNSDGSWPNPSIPSFIPIKESFIYLGITIYKNIHKIARDNFNNILVKVKNDIQRWKNLKVSLQGRISKNLLRWICYLDLIFFLYATTFSPSRLLQGDQLHNF